MAQTHRDPTVGPHAGLLDWLAGHGIDYEMHEHPLAFTATEAAALEGIDPHRFAKTLVVETTEGRRALLVVDAIDHVDLGKAAAALGTAHVRLLTESEMAELAPTFEVGTIPPIGALVGLEVVADTAVREDADIAFHAGSHHFSVHVDRAGWERATDVRYVDLAASRGEPAWAR
jgi:prolyl-tRNA editing enzyme YbaK/EbsC (Cys-tRNA(Pro) deacylase)